MTGIGVLWAEGTTRCSPQPPATTQAMRAARIVGRAVLMRLCGKARRTPAVVVGAGANAPHCRVR